MRTVSLIGLNFCRRNIFHLARVNSTAILLSTTRKANVSNMAAVTLSLSKSNPHPVSFMTAEHLKANNKRIDVSYGDKNMLMVTNDIILTLDHTISRYLGRLHQQLGLYGSNNIQSSEVDHWMDFSVMHFENAQNLHVDTIKYLDQNLSSASFLVGNKITLADFAVWNALYRNPKWVGMQKNTKASTHVLRWFNFCSAQDVFKKAASVMPSSTPRKVAEKGDDKSKSLKSTMEDGGKFIRLPNAKDGEVVVRFPPEASGYLHIGHAKAALMNQYYKDLHNGKLIMRFDDTNPAKENAHFEEIILEDIKLLQLTPDIYSRTSDHFEILLKYGEQLIRESKAYCDDTPAEEMRQIREKKLKPKNRDNSIEKNLSMWNEMKLGSDIGRGCCLRAVINYQSDNGCLRDPVMYRCRPEPHLVTGDKYKVYPTYDFACPIVDSIEGVTHALRTTEYHDRNPQYFWVLKALGLREPFIYDYSRLALVNTVLSKRKLTHLVDQGFVDGWDDPRLPTVRGILRRGLTIEGLKEFIIAQGSSKANVHMEWDKIWSFNKKVIDPICPRYTALLKSKVVPVHVDGAIQSPAEYQCNPKNPDIGTKTVWYGKKVFIEGEDVSVLNENDLVTFINWGNLRIKNIVRDDKGEVDHIKAALELDNKDFKKTVKLTWLADNEDATFTPTVCLHFDHIISKAVITKNDDFKQLINKDTKTEYEMLGDPCLRTITKGQVIQLQRRGYYICDQAYAPPSRHSGRAQPCVLINVPDGHTKNMPSSGSSAPSSSTVPASTPKVNPVASAKEAPNSNTKDTTKLSADITAQGDKIRQLKSEKADKATIKPEVDRLLALKAEFKTITGEDYKPSTAQPQQQPKAVVQTNAKDTEKLSSEITAQGDKVRQLKSEKAGKATIKAEVEKLLALKTEYKQITGQDFKPSAVQPQQQQLQTTAVSQGDAGKLSSDISIQGDKVRRLKSEKADKATIKAEVDRLLALKAEYKSLTGQEFKPTAVQPQQQNQNQQSKMVVQGDCNATEELKAKITEQGNTVRSLKAASAPKADIDAAVQILLSLKATYKTATGEDFPAPSSGGGKRDKKSKSKQPAQQTKQEAKPVSATPAANSQDGGKKVTRLGLEAKKEEMLSDWYSQVITKSEMIEYYDVSGCYTLRPWAYGIWERIKEYFDDKIKASGVENCYFPMFVSQQALEKEKEHISDFAPEVAWVTKSGQSELAEPIAIRPTSETVMYPAYAKWIKSHRDLPLRLNQWCNVVRWEFKHPQPFLRTREFLWQEGHTAFAGREEACKEVFEILEYYAEVYNNLLAIPVVKGKKTEKEKFAGGDFTTTCEAYIEASGRAIQGATSHHLGQNFSKMFDIVFEDPSNPDAKEKMYVHQNSWGITTRTIGVMVMVHGDNKGLVLPPRVAHVQVVIVPCGLTASMNEQEKEELLSKCEEYSSIFKKQGIRSKADLRDNYSAGWKFNHWELKGVPIRIELGPRDMKSNQIVAVRRDTGEKVTLPFQDCVTKISELLETIQSDMHSRLAQKALDLIGFGSIWAKKQLDDNLVVCSKWDDFVSALDNKKLIQAPFCGGIQCEERIKKDSARDEPTESGAPSMGAKSLCIPFEQPNPLDASAKCIHPKCNEKATGYTMFGRSY